MTAFSREETTQDWGTAIWEIRTVNNRYLDISTRLPEDLRTLEPSIRERVGKKLTRGKVDCTLRFHPKAGSVQELTLNTELVTQIASAGKRIDELLGTDSRLRSLDLLRWPGVIEATHLDLDSVANEILRLLDVSLDSVARMRTREGEKIRGMINERCSQVTKISQLIRENMPLIQAQLKERVMQRLTDFLEQLDAERIEQEMVMLASKMDVSEELDRLDAHCSEVARLIDSDKPVGRRLDFLMQELNREANTLGSKSGDTKMTRASVDLKVLIEQMREQIQNIE